MDIKKIQYADDDVTPLGRLVRMRIPSLAVGLVLGILLSFVTSWFEIVLTENIKLAFFIPFIVYMADAVGGQTQNIYVRDLRTGHASFKKYLIKEGALGIILGAAASGTVALITIVWFKSWTLTQAISLATFGAIMTAPLIALLVVELFELERTDPAVGAGPISAVIQDILSILIYGAIATLVIL